MKHISIKMNIIYALIQKYLLINIMFQVITRETAMTNISSTFMKPIFYSDGGREKASKQTNIFLQMCNMPCGDKSYELS